MVRLYPVKKGRIITKMVLFSLIAAFVFAIFLFGFKETVESTSTTQYDITKHSINSALICCYSIEGNYPQNIGYLEENYGLKIDYNKYIVDYKYLAGNIFPIVYIAIKGTT